MSDRSTSIKRILVFLALTFAFSTVFYGLIIRAGTLSAKGGLYMLGLMWCPGLAAIITTLLFQQNLRGLGWRLGPPRYLWISYMLPFAYALPVYVLVWLTGLGEFSTEAIPASTPVPVYVLLLATVGVFTGGLLSGLGEEIGWRGLLVPELRKLTSFTNTVLIGGGIWAVWHTPLLFFADYNAGTPWWYGFLCFAIMVVGASFAFAWLRIKSDSVWPAALLHASHNLFIQSVFDVMTRDTGRTLYIAGEFGAGLALTCAVMAYLIWRKRATL
ncbi:MAG: CPBP family intramembrane metalloprotease [Anaerolineae bacterium]|nr:CPBP family intramembrane metalloprotease [Anaerolineae bacterium]